MWASEYMKVQGDCALVSVEQEEEHLDLIYLKIMSYLSVFLSAEKVSDLRTSKVCWWDLVSNIYKHWGLDKQWHRSDSLKPPKTEECWNKNSLGTEGPRYPEIYAALNWLLKQMLIKTIYTTCNYFRADSAGDSSKWSLASLETVTKDFSVSRVITVKLCRGCKAVFTRQKRYCRSSDLGHNESFTVPSFASFWVMFVSAKLVWLQWTLFV